jgi:hypothetical protein
MSDGASIRANLWATVPGRVTAPSDHNGAPAWEAGW